MGGLHELWWAPFWLSGMIQPIRLAKPASFSKYFLSSFYGPGLWNNTEEVPSLFLEGWVRGKVKSRPLSEEWEQDSQAMSWGKGIFQHTALEAGFIKFPSQRTNLAPRCWGPEAFSWQRRHSAPPCPLHLGHSVCQPTVSAGRESVEDHAIRLGGGEEVQIEH